MVARAAEDLATAERAILVEEAAIATATAAETAHLDASQAAQGEVLLAEETLARHRAHRARFAVTAGRAGELARAEGSLVAISAPLAAAEATVVTLAAGVEGTLPPAPGPAPDVAQATGQERAAASALARLEEQARAAAEVAAEVDALERAVAEAGTVVATWELLAQAFGPDGIQALEIDAACPALSELATGYLHKHFGPRWSIRIDTREEDGEAEDGAAGVLNINVFDAEEGRKGDILFFSPGERAFLGRAFAGALAFLICSRIGAREPTLILDETAGAVSPGNLDAYMGMIRGIAEDIGAHRVILVVQSPTLAALADSIIRVERGTIRVESP
jgi:exonuclease SbcC